MNINRPYQETPFRSAPLKENLCRLRVHNTNSDTIEIEGVDKEDRAAGDQLMEDYHEIETQTPNQTKSGVSRICRPFWSCVRNSFPVIAYVLLGALLYVVISKSCNLPLVINTSNKGDDMMECHGTDPRKGFPDLDYALFGYNMVYGYPLAPGHDPGLTHPIFKADYSAQRFSADCRYHVPKGYILVPDVACITSFTSETIKDSSSFEKSMSASAQASGGGWGMSFSASAEYNEKSSEMSASESVYIFSTAKCNYYFAMLDEYDPPPFTQTFLKAVKGLSTVTNNTDNADLFQFFTYFGTHYLTYTLFGARFVYEHKMSKKNFLKSSSEATSISVSASYSGVVSLSGGFGLSSSQSKAASNFRDRVETKTISIGSPPPANGDTMTWASNVKADPIPVSYRMDSIENLFTERYMAGTGIDYEKIRERIINIKAKKLFISHLENKGVISEYNEFKLERAVVKLPKLYIDGGIKYSKNEQQCRRRCNNDQLCFAVATIEPYSVYRGKPCFIHRMKKNANFINSIQEGSNDTATINMQNVNGHAQTLLPIPPMLRNIFFISIKEDYNVTIFMDNLNLINMVFKIHRAKITVHDALNSVVVGDEQECSNTCLREPMCTAYTFLLSREFDEVKNCFIHDLNDKKYKVNVDPEILPIKIADNYVTVFQPLKIDADN